VDGFEISTDEFGEEYVVLTEERQRQQRRLRLSLLLKQAGITRPDYGLGEYKGEDKAGNLPKIKKYVSDFERFKTVSLYLWSKGNSSQKTTVAKNIILELLLSGYECRFVLMADLLTLLQKEAFGDAAIAAEIAGLRAVDFLVIDDAFDPRKATLYKSGYQFSFLDTFLRYRLETVNKATCFTSNVPISEIGKTWTPSIMSLVQRSVPTPMEFCDYLNDFKKEDIWL